jgi:hypothetical protein
MVRLFRGMDYFIHVFYKSLSPDAGISPYASTNALVDEMPRQSSEKLLSNYDHDRFHCQPNPDDPLMVLKWQLGTSAEDLLNALKWIHDALHAGKFEFYVPPELDQTTLMIHGVLSIPENGRRGFFKLYFQQDLQQPV